MRIRLKTFVYATMLAAVLVVFGACGGSQGDSGSSVGDSGLPDAPAFELVDQFNNEYKFEPGDGQNHILVFYMGYF